MRRNILIKSILVGIVVLILDFIAHNTIGNKEVLTYFIAKPFVAAITAFLMFRSWEPKGKWILIPLYSTTFAFFHGWYYRLLELFLKQPLLSRVGDVDFGLFVLRAGTDLSGILQSALAWLIVHGGAFFLGTLLALFLVKDDGKL